MLMQEAL